MKVSFNWLKEYVDIDISPEELANRLTNTGVVVEKIEYLNKGVSNVVVGQVLKAERHPDAEKLSLCEVTTGQESNFQVVCGAPNVKAGQKVPFALVGAKLPGGVKIKKAKLRGIESQGMICSAKELGMEEDILTPEEKEGILVLDENAPLGQDIINFLNLDDCVLEFDLTPNRSDCLSVLNIAREIAALLDKEVKLPEISFTETEKDVKDLVEVEIDNMDLCRRYTARVIEGIEIKPSPQWLRHKIRCAGMRPINNVVDITNYVMLEMGQPLHAFDYDFLCDGKIIVREAAEGEEIITLDEKERKLSPGMLLIADKEKAVGIAGVMGGLNSEVIDKTKRVLLESAYFNPTSIRRTSTSLGLRSEASIRFEKGINIETVVEAGNRAAQLLQQLAVGKVLKGIIDNYPNPIQRTIITLKISQVNDVLGTEIEEGFIKDILQSLNFRIIDADKEQLTIEVPPYRPDVTIAEDLIEEVARMYGYDNIPTTLPYGTTSKGQKTSEQKLRDMILDSMVAAGLSEIISFSFINKKNFDKLLLPENHPKRKAIAVLNPISEEQGYMRTTLLPGLLENLLRNINRRNENLGIFELGKIYLPNGFPQQETLPQERWVLGIALRGKLGENWQDKGTEVDFYYIKGVIEMLLEKLNLQDITFKPQNSNESYHPGRTAEIYIKDKLIGIVGELHPQVAENYDLPGRNYTAELDVSQLLEIGQQDVIFKALPKYPAVNRDLAVVVQDGVTSGDLLKLIENEGGSLLARATVFDLYKGDQIPEGCKSIAFSLTFQADDRTLTDKEINDIYDKIYNALVQEYDATLRA